MVYADFHDLLQRVVKINKTTDIVLLNQMAINSYSVFQQPSRDLKDITITEQMSTLSMHDPLFMGHPVRVSNDCVMVSNNVKNDLEFKQLVRIIVIAFTAITITGWRF